MVTTGHHRYPPFPDDVPTAPLVSISLAKLEAGDVGESQALFEACKNFGFYYLQLQGSKLGENILDEVERLNKVQETFHARPQVEKEEYAREKIDEFFGYRQAKLKILDEHGEPKRNEGYNMRKDDFAGNCTPLPYHPLVTQNWDLFKSYIYNSRAAIDIMTRELEKQLQLPVGAIGNLHRIGERSGDHVRFRLSAVQPFSEEEAKQYEHTDFGTFAVVFNWLGGLQVRLPDTMSWVYVKPVPGAAVVNLGDAMVKFTAGILRSNIHRVVPPPPPQNVFQRTSVVYLSRPEDKVVLKRLEGGLVDLQPFTKEESEASNMTAQEWILRRSLGDLKGVYTHKGGLELRPPPTMVAT